MNSYQKARLEKITLIKTRARLAHSDTVEYHKAVLTELCKIKDIDRRLSMILLAGYKVHRGKYGAYGSRPMTPIWIRSRTPSGWVKAYHVASQLGDYDDYITYAVTIEDLLHTP